MRDDTTWLDATDQAALVTRREASPTELTEAAIGRIDRLNPELNAVIHELFDRARDAAAGQLPDGPFRGVPLLLKDLGAELAGTPFCEGTDFAGNYHSTVDQELSKRFVAAGFVVCGKTNTPEFGILPTTEPRRFGPSRMVPVAHANDGGGSIRIPASCCGLVGLKPTRARVSLGPQYGDLMGGLVAEHVVTRTVRDSAAILDAIAGPVPGDPYWAPPRRGPSFAAAVDAEPRPLRVAVMTASPTGSAVHADCVTATEEAAALCASLGHDVEPAALMVDGDAFTEHFINVWAAGNAWTLLDWEQRVGRTATEEDVEPLTWSLVEIGRALDSGRYLRSMQELQKLTRQIAEYFEGIDVLLTPTLGEPPAPLGTFDSPADAPLTGLFRAAAYVPFTPPFNVTGQPGISLPLHWNDGGLPIGVQFVGRFGEEETLLSLAGQLERAAPWADRRPAVSA
jgi:amidase